MATSKRMRALAKKQYGIFYPEGPGYLHLDQVAEGSQGIVVLVLSCADGQVYVRKRGTATDAHWNLIPYDYGCEEVFFYREHRLTPRLIDWVIYRPLPRGHPSYFEYLSTSTIWEYCDLGDVRELIDAYARANIHGDHALGAFPYKHAIPEALIWKIFGQLIQAVTFFHHARPPIAHMDIFVGNVFLRHRGDEELPDCCLGDFGKSLILSPEAWNSRGRLNKRRTLSRRSNPAQFSVQDYRAIILLVKQLMTLDYSFDSEETAKAHYEKHDEFFEDLELTHTGNTSGSPIPQDDEPLSNFPVDRQRELYQSSRQDGFYRYTPLLFDTIRDLEERLETVMDLSKGIRRETASNRDWTYIGEAMEKKAIDRLNNQNEGNYPPVDDTFQVQIDSLKVGLEPDHLAMYALYSRTDILAAIDRKNPIGPFRIARLDPSTLAVKAVSQKTYNTFDRFTGADAQGSTRSDLSAVHDPLQMDNVAITSQLNRENLN